MNRLEMEAIVNIIRRTQNQPVPYRGGAIEDQFGRLVENMFEEFFSPFTPYSSLRGGGAEGGLTSPRLNVTETDKSFEIEAELPGVKKEDIMVAVDNQRVTIEAEAKQESERKEGENVVYAERSTRRFARSFMLPADVDDSAAQARLENGVLILSLPKKQASQAKRLTIQ